MSAAVAMLDDAAPATSLTKFGSTANVGMFVTAVTRLAITSVIMDSIWKLKMTRATPADSVMPRMFRIAAKERVRRVVAITDTSVLLPIAMQPSPPSQRV